MHKFLIIQTAFIGDVVLATGLIEKLHEFFPEARIDFLLRKGNEALLKDHPFVNEVLVWDKQQHKFQNLIKMIAAVRSRHYDKVINVQRFAASGILTVCSGAKEKIGFNKNPLSFLFSRKVKHIISVATNPLHEVNRNNALVEHFTDSKAAKPRLYPSTADKQSVAAFKVQPYICLSPASVWFTKQFPKEKWIEFLKRVPISLRVYILGARADWALAEEIISASRHLSIQNLCGKLSYLQSAALMQDAEMNFVNDSAPMHFASAMNAPVTAIYCSTLPSFGFGPLSDQSMVVETKEQLSCRPCGLHGKKACPLGHFRCAYGIDISQLTGALGHHS